MSDNLTNQTNETKYYNDVVANSLSSHFTYARQVYVNGMVMSTWISSQIRQELDPRFEAWLSNDAFNSFLSVLNLSTQLSGINNNEISNYYLKSECDKKFLSSIELATEDDIGGIRLFSDIDLLEAGKYVLELSDNGKAFVNVPQINYLCGFIQTGSDLCVAIDNDTIRYTNDGKLSAAIQEIPSNIATRVISNLIDQTIEYHNSNVLSDFTLSVSSIENPTPDEVWGAVSTLIRTLGGRIVS